MNRADRQQLDEYFAKARIEPPATTEDEILSFLDSSDTPGQPPLPVENHTDTLRNRFKGITMKVIAFSIVAASLGSAALFFNTQQPDQIVLPVTRQTAAPVTPQQHTAPSSPAVSVQKNIVTETPVQHTTPRTTTPVRATIPAPNPVASANKPKNDTPAENAQGIDSAMTHELGEMLSKYAAEYWVEKINDYRVRIDRMLSETDRTELSQLRVRWDIAMANEDEGDGDGMNMNFNIGDKKKENVDNNNGKHGSFSISLGSSTSADGEKEISTSTKVNDEEMDPKVAMQMVMNMMAAGGDERAIIIKSVKEMSENYRPQLNGLKEVILTDIADFMTNTSDRVEQFIAKHRNEFSPELIDSVSANLDKVHQGVTSDEIRTAIGMLYDFIGEPILMLYNGADIAGLVPASIAAPVPGMKINESNALRQSTPNPASSQATISYMLNEPSSRTTLRLYDASGKVVSTMDQGAQPAGERSATLDVSSLAPGTYLYHLTIQTSKGEQVFSKTLQVAR